MQAPIMFLGEGKQAHDHQSRQNKSVYEVLHHGYHSTGLAHYVVGDRATKDDEHRGRSRQRAARPIRARSTGGGKAGHDPQRPEQPGECAVRCQELYDEAKRKNWTAISMKTTGSARLSSTKGMMAIVADQQTA